MKIDELIEKAPPQLRPVIAKYAPALADMAVEEAWAWIELLVGGKTREAWGVIVSRMDGNDDLLAAGESLSVRWAQANAHNAEKLLLQRSAVLATLRALLTAALMGLGL